MTKMCLCWNIMCRRIFSYFKCLLLSSCHSLTVNLADEWLRFPVWNRTHPPFQAPVWSIFSHSLALFTRCTFLHKKLIVLLWFGLLLTTAPLRHGKTGSRVNECHSLIGCVNWHSELPEKVATSWLTLRFQSNSRMQVRGPQTTMVDETSWFIKASQSK